MIKIDYRHLQVKPNLKKYKKKLKEIQKMPAPAFETTKPKLNEIASKIKKYRKYKNVILIANGGSRTSAHAFYHALSDFRNKVNFEFLTSNEPGPILKIKKKYSPKDTLVLVVSKSGNTVNAIEPLMSFLNYPVLVIVGKTENVLRQIARRRKWEIIIHPEVSGRYSAMTNCGLVPAALMGLNLKDIYQGAQNGYKKYTNKIGLQKNNALRLALDLWDLEQKGFTEIFMSLYSTPLLGCFPILVPLFHESTGKNGKGHTVFGDISPEAQHHTIQRLFDGRRNVIAFFMSVEKSQKDFIYKIPKDLSNIDFYGYPLSKLNGLPASKTMYFDLQGVLHDCIDKKIPVAKLTVDQITPRSIGEFLVFWFYFSTYSAYLRSQDPFNQPGVEASKKISLKLRMER